MSIASTSDVSFDQQPGIDVEDTAGVVNYILCNRARLDEALFVDHHDLLGEHRIGNTIKELSVDEVWRFVPLGTGQIADWSPTLCGLAFQQSATRSRAVEVW